MAFVFDPSASQDSEPPASRYEALVRPYCSGRRGGGVPLFIQPTVHSKSRCGVEPKTEAGSEAGNLSEAKKSYKKRGDGVKCLTPAGGAAEHLSPTLS